MTRVGISRMAMVRMIMVAVVKAVKDSWNLKVVVTKVVEVALTQNAVYAWANVTIVISDVTPTRKTQENGNDYNRT